MKYNSIIFLGAALITALIGFTGLNFDGIEIIRVLCLIFTDLFVVSLIARAFFPDQKVLGYQKIKD